MRRRSSKALRDAQQYYKFLLYIATGGNIGQAPAIEIKNDLMTFGEKRGLLDSIIRISELERKSAEGSEEETGFDEIRRRINASGTSSDRGNSGTGTESASDEPSESTETDNAQEF